MPTHAKRLSLSFATLLLGCTALSGGAQAGWFSSDSDSDKPAVSDRKAVVKTDTVQPAATLDGSVRQAQLLRLAGQYPDAIKHLSQLMMIASDDARVVTEYGKTLAAMGRAQEAVNFLTRAQQLSPTDWSVYSALGVAYDQLGKQGDAQSAYEHALTLRPGEPSVLNNYALSRMLSKDPDGARTLMARAQTAGGASDPMIARNIAMVNEMAPEGAAKTPAANLPAQVPVPAAHIALAAPQPAPRAAVVQHAMPQVASAAPVIAPAPPVSAPRPLMPAMASTTALLSAPQVAPPANRVVMQRVPLDPLAGPVQPRVTAVATHAPRALSKPPEKEAAAPAPTPAPVPVKTAATAALELQAKADAIAKQLAAKPQAKASVVAAASKPDAADAKTGPVTAKLVVKADAKTDVKADAKPAPVKTADAKPAPAKPKPAKDSVPALRLSANAY
jgi:Flp pilus assembly protein TadD